MKNMLQTEINLRVDERLKTGGPGWICKTQGNGAVWGRTATGCAGTYYRLLDRSYLCLMNHWGALDRSLREDLLAELRRILRESRVPVIYVTHDQEEPLHWLTGSCLHDGQIKRAGSPERVWRDPGSPQRRVFCWVGEYSIRSIPG